MVRYNPKGIDGVIEVLRGNLYVKKQESLQPLLGHLREVGYTVRDTSSDESFGEKSPREVQEKNGWYLWFGSLEDDVLQHKAECGSCGSIIERDGVRKHDHRCECCGAPTYLEFVNGGEVSFSFADDQNPGIKKPTMVVHSYDKENRKLRFYATPEDCKDRRERRMRNFDYTPAEIAKILPELLKRFPQTLQLEEVDGVEVVSVPYNDDHRLQDHGINISRVEGQIHNYGDADFFRGRRMKPGLCGPELPCPDSVTIYEAWHWVPLKPGPDLYEKIIHAAGQVSRKDYYYQDGSPAFSKEVIDRMLRFVEHFTTLDARKIKHYLHTGLSGPGLIDVLAKLTGHKEYIETEPNVGNALVMFGKVVSGESVNKEEFVEGWKGVNAAKDGSIIREILGDDFVDNALSDGADEFGLSGDDSN